LEKEKASAESKAKFIDNDLLQIDKAKLRVEGKLEKLEQELQVRINKL
jgi:hypothetical protein